LHHRTHLTRGRHVVGRGEDGSEGKEGGDEKEEADRRKRQHLDAAIVTVRMDAGDCVRKVCGVEYKEEAVRVVSGMTVGGVLVGGGGGGGCEECSVGRSYDVRCTVHVSVND